MERAHNTRCIFLIYAVLALATFVAYEHIRQNDFVGYDDDFNIYDNPHITGGLTWKSITWAFTTFQAPSEGHWQPITRLSHMLNCELFGLNPSWHHLTSLWLHIANTLLLFWVLKRMTNKVWHSAFVAAAFGLHPLHVESVAWATERRDMLSGLFFMLSIWAYIRYTERPSVKRYLPLSLALALGLMSKSILVTLPCVLLLLDYWPLRRLQQARQNRNQDLPANQLPNSRSTWLPAVHLIGEKIPLFILAIIACVITVFASQGSISDLSSLSIQVRIVNSLNSYFGYIVKMVYPVHLAVLYPYPKQLRIDTALLFLVGVAILMARFTHKRPWLTVGLLWFLGTLVPVIGLVQVGMQAMADRYTYLPSIGIFIIVTWGAAELVTNWRYQRLTLGIIAGTVLAMLLICTRVQVKYWKNSFTLYRHTLAVTKDNFLIHNNLADLLLEDDKVEEAIIHLEESLLINPKLYLAHYNLGRAFLKQEKLDKAVASFNEALELQPDHPYSNYNIAIAMTRQGNYDDAIRYFNVALRLRRNWPEAYNNLGLVYFLMGKHDLAIQNYNIALQFKPDYPSAINNLKIALQKQGKAEEKN